MSFPCVQLMLKSTRCAPLAPRNISLFAMASPSSVHDENAQNVTFLFTAYSAMMSFGGFTPRKIVPDWSL